MLQEKTNLLYSLILNCPFNLGCVECPFVIIRQKGLDERISYIESLDENESNELAFKHYNNYMKNFVFDGFLKNPNSF